MIERISLDQRINNKVDQKDKGIAYRYLNDFHEKLWPMHLESFFWAWPWAVDNIRWLYKYHQYQSPQTYGDLLNFYDWNIPNTMLPQMMFLPFFGETRMIYKTRRGEEIMPYCHDSVSVRSLKDRQEYASLIAAFRNLSRLKLCDYSDAALQLCREAYHEKFSRKLLNSIWKMAACMDIHEDDLLIYLFKVICDDLETDTDGKQIDANALMAIKTIFVRVPLYCSRNAVISDGRV